LTIAIYWHEQIKIADIGNILQGQTAKDSAIALRTVLQELLALGKKVVVLGGSHDLSLEQYELFKSKGEIVDLIVLDMLADLEQNSPLKFDSHLVDVLTTTPNFIRNFTLAGFQSYYVNPAIVETLDRFGFDCLRLGKVQEDMLALEPIMRMCSIGSIDINCIRQADAPSNRLASPNGFSGTQACQLTKFAGMSEKMKCFGIFGYEPGLDENNLTAKLIAQMLWYYMDGLHLVAKEKSLGQEDAYLEYQISFTEQNLRFRKSKQTNRCIECEIL